MVIKPDSYNLQYYVVGRLKLRDFDGIEATTPASHNMVLR